jgi:hypothetical protein
MSVYGDVIMVGTMVTGLGTTKQTFFKNWSSMLSTTYNYYQELKGLKKKTGEDIFSPGSHHSIGWRSYAQLSFAPLYCMYSTLKQNPKLE